MSILITVNRNSGGESFLIAPDQNHTFPTPLSLRSDDGSTVNATLNVLPGGADIILETTTLEIGPIDSITQIQAASPSNSRGDTILQVLVDGVVQTSCPLTAITNLKLWFQGRFQARFATGSDPYNEPRGQIGWTWALEDEPNFVPADSVADSIDKFVGRMIRFHNPIALRPHVPPIGVKIVSITGNLATGAEVEFTVGDPVLGQPVNLGAKSYFAGNRPIRPGDPPPAESYPDAQEPIGNFEFHIGEWFAGKSKQPEDRPITPPPPLHLIQLTPEELIKFNISSLADFNVIRKSLLLADYKALSPEAQTGTVIGRNLATRISFLGGDVETNIPAAPASRRTLVAGYIAREWFRGFINDAIQIDTGNSAVLAFLAGFDSFRFSTNFFNFHSDELCGQVYGYISSAADELVDPTSHIVPAEVMRTVAPPIPLSREQPPSGNSD
jgi:hypothetical protein